MASATQLDLFIEGFADSDSDTIVYEYQLQLQNSDGSPMDIEGASSSFKAKKNYTDSEALMILDDENDGITVDDENSILLLQIRVADFSNINLNRETVDLVYDWDLSLDGRKYRLMRGNLTVGGDI